ncbi:MAG: AbrB/MazE/SpoVT family DNA-binding domain-containing protein [Planctomycetes bacterium]|nr:AbrB/MazE/SpoVT family DNA-binding domain-containing protein [Planctomycetota bacterium]
MRYPPRKVRVQKWRAQLALRIPTSHAAELGLAAGEVVKLAVEGGKLIVTPEPRSSGCVAQLLRGITEENRHEEFDTGPRFGRELG